MHLPRTTIYHTYRDLHATIFYVEDFFIQNVGVDMCTTHMCQIVKWPLKPFLDNINVCKTQNHQTI